GRQPPFSAGSGLSRPWHQDAARRAPVRGRVVLPRRGTVEKRVAIRPSNAGRPKRLGQQALSETAPARQGVGAVSSCRTDRFRAREGAGFPADDLVVLSDLPARPGRNQGKVRITRFATAGNQSRNTHSVGLASEKLGTTVK